MDHQHQRVRESLLARHGPLASWAYWPNGPNFTIGPYRPHWTAIPNKQVDGICCRSEVQNTVVRAPYICKSKLRLGI
jgi:hypothetical protein